MAAIGIMSYGMPPNLKLKNAFNKITITTTNSNNNVGILSDNSSNKLVINSNTIVKKIKDFGMIGIANKSGSLIMRKKQKLVPLNESNSENISQSNRSSSDVPQPPAKKLKTSTKCVEAKTAGSQLKIVGESISVGTPGRKGLPPPQAVARRNARERNRVKQVNNGFAALRQHIPEEIAKTFESASANNRGSAKKLSKVETLRMAVEYIRGLEKLLGYEIPPVSPLSADESCCLIKDEFGPISPMNDNFDNFDDSNGGDQDQDLSQIADNLPNITTLNGLQYIRIPGTNTYQLLTADLFGNEENFSPLIDVNCYPNGEGITDEEIPVSILAAAAVAPASTPSGMSPPPPTSTTSTMVMSPLPLSPTTSSSSPAAGGILLPPIMSVSRGNNDHYMMPPQFQSMNDVPHHLHDRSLERVKIEPSDIVYHLQEQHLLGNSSPHLDGSGQGYYITTSSGENSSEEQSLYEGVVRLKKELGDVILDTSTAALSDESMMDAIDWWEANTPKSDGGTLM